MAQKLDYTKILVDLWEASCGECERRIRVYHSRLPPIVLEWFQLWGWRRGRR